MVENILYKIFLLCLDEKEAVKRQTELRELEFEYYNTNRKKYNSDGLGLKNQSLSDHTSRFLRKKSRDLKRKIELNVNDGRALFDSAEKPDFTPNKKMLYYPVNKTPDVQFILPELTCEESVFLAEFSQKGKYVYIYKNLLTVSLTEIDLIILQPKNMFQLHAFYIYEKI
jgi:hypothetical protein